MWQPWQAMVQPHNHPAQEARFLQAFWKCCLTILIGIYLHVTEPHHFLVLIAHSHNWRADACKEPAALSFSLPTRSHNLTLLLSYCNRHKPCSNLHWFLQGLTFVQLKLLLILLCVPISGGTTAAIFREVGSYGLDLATCWVVWGKEIYFCVLLMGWIITFEFGNSLGEVDYCLSLEIWGLIHYVLWL